MKRLLSLIILFTALSLSSCIKEDYPDATRTGNFEALWRLMDEHYCFFDYKKKALGVDWNEIHARYAKQVDDAMTPQQLFEVLCNMIGELKDGHVNLGAAFDLGRNWSYHEDYPRNYNDSIIMATYLGHDYKIAAGLKYKLLDDNIGYVRCASFNSGVGHGNVSYMLEDLATCTGIIIDVRANGGGELTNAHNLASHFINERTLIGYISHKTGKAHDAFSTPQPEYLNPGSGMRWQKQVIVLTNRECYSATNDFVRCMKLAPHCTIMGDKTGGGSGMPFTSELPNGWSVRYSAVVNYDKDMNHTEFGIEPDIRCEMSGADTQRQRDTLIETARTILKQQ